MSHLEDVMARHQHYLERYKTGQYNKFAPFLSRLEDALIKRLSRQNTFNSQKRIKAVLNAIYDDTFTQLSDFTKEFDQELIELGVAEVDFAAQTLIKEGVDLTGQPSLTQILAAVRARPFNSKLLREELSLFSREQSKYIRNVVAMGFAEGRTNQQIIQDVIGSKDLNFKDGALQPTRVAASRMVRTAIQHTSSVAKQELYDDNDDLFTHYEWVSTLDGRTSMTCKARDGIVYRVRKGPLPPAHPNCRSTTVPVFDEDIVTVDGVKRSNAGGKRPAAGSGERGQVSGNTNYNDWLKRQSKQFQIDALGKTKAELFREGGLSIDKFVDRLDKPLTLEQLKATYPTAWEKAKL